MTELISQRHSPISKSFEEDGEAGKLDKAKEIVGIDTPCARSPKAEAKL